MFKFIIANDQGTASLGKFSNILNFSVSLAVTAGAVTIVIVTDIINTGSYDFIEI